VKEEKKKQRKKELGVNRERTLVKVKTQEESIINQGWWGIMNK